MGVVGWISVFGNVEILLHDSSRIREERPVSTDACTVLIGKSDMVGAYGDQTAICHFQLTMQLDK